MLNLVDTVVFSGGSKNVRTNISVDGVSLTMPQRNWRPLLCPIPT